MAARLNYGKTFLLGFGFFGISVIWGVYNAFVPIFLFEKFHLSPIMIGFFMTLDNIAALFIQPPAGALLTGIMPLPLVGIPLVEGGRRMLTLAGVFLIIAGAAWAFVNINSLPMIVDLTTAARIGTFTGLYYLFSTLSAIIGPNLNGLAIQLTNNNYNVIMLIAPGFMLIAFWLILGVKRGEAVTS